MSRELLQARFDADDVEQVEQYAEQKDISRSEAMRRLLRAGADVVIEADDNDTEQAVAAYPGTTETDASELLQGDSRIINEKHLFDVIQVVLLLAILGVLLI